MDRGLLEAHRFCLPEWEDIALAEKPVLVDAAG